MIDSHVNCSVLYGSATDTKRRSVDIWFSLLRDAHDFYSVRRRAVEKHSDSVTDADVGNCDRALFVRGRSYLTLQLVRISLDITFERTRLIPELADLPIN